MNIQLVEEALTVIPSKQLLTNVMSRRVRQLAGGSRPMIQAEARMGYADIALAEIIAGYVLPILEGKEEPEEGLIHFEGENNQEIAVEEESFEEVVG